MGGSLSAGVAAVKESRRERVLVVDDDREFCGELSALLRRYGFEVCVVHEAAAVASALQSFQPTVLVLDQFVDGTDMLSRILELRRSFKGGLMVLTGNDDLSDRVLALEWGADDYVLKTIHPRELLARLRVLARRGSPGEAAVERRPQVLLSVPDERGWVVNVARREVRAPNGDQVPLTGLEFDAFRLLYERQGEIVGREELARAILDRHISASGRSIENLLSRVRSKLAAHLAGSLVIRAVRGKGYVFLGFS